MDRDVMFLGFYGQERKTKALEEWIGMLCYVSMANYRLLLVLLQDTRDYIADKDLEQIPAGLLQGILRPGGVRNYHVAPLCLFSLQQVEVEDPSQNIIYFNTLSWDGRCFHQIGFTFERDYVLILESVTSTALSMDRLGEKSRAVGGMDRNVMFLSFYGLLQTVTDFIIGLYESKYIYIYRSHIYIYVFELTAN